jgi:hypothetical protein
MMRRYGGRTHDPNRAHIGRILQPADTGQIRSAVCAPVTYKRQNFGFKQYLVHSCSFYILDVIPFPVYPFAGFVAATAAGLARGLNRLNQAIIGQQKQTRSFFY